MYEEFISKLKESFNNIENVNVVFNVKNINNDMLIEYLKNIINFYSNESSMLSMFVDNKIELEDNKLTKKKKQEDVYKLVIKDTKNIKNDSQLVIEIDS